MWGAPRATADGRLYWDRGEVVSLEDIGVDGDINLATFISVSA